MSKRIPGINFLLMALLVEAATKIFAADADSRAALPDGPLLSKSPALSAWQIDYSYASDKQAAQKPAPTPAVSNAPPLIQSLSVLPPRTLILTRTKPIWHAVLVDISGGKAEQWFDGSARYFLQKGYTPFITSNSESRFPDFTTIDFPDMNWVSASTFVGTEVMDAHPCLVFSKGDMKAWIDTQSRFPVRWQRKEETRKFRELPAPSDILTLPEELVPLSRAVKQADVRRHTPVPY